MTARYQWHVGGKPVAGATKRTYRVRAADSGKRIRVRVIGSKSGHRQRAVWTKPTPRVRR